MITITIIISASYCLLLLFFLIGFFRIKEFSPIDSITDTCFSIIIPFRNEAENLDELLKSLTQVNYPKKKFEIILVNDDSNDDSVKIFEKFKTYHTLPYGRKFDRRVQNSKLTLNLINNQRKSNSPKKDAIDIAIKTAKFDWVITTDADCVFPRNWLKTLDEFIQYNKPKMVVMPVLYEYQNNFLSKFQILELLSLQGTTIGGFGINKPFLCNGANLCYKKSCFSKIDGFSGNENIASGDDIFILEKMLVKYPSQVKYLKSKEVIVKTKTENKISDLINQRIRWATKTTSYNHNFGKFVGLTVLLMNFWIITLLILAIFTVISWQQIGFVFLSKFIIDLSLIYPVSIFFQQQKIMRTYFVSSFLYPFFNVYIAILSFKKSYNWKGRTFSK